MTWLMEILKIQIFDKNIAQLTDKSVSGAHTSGGTVKSEIIQKKNLAKALHKPFIKNFHQKEFRIEKPVKRKGDKLYFKWKGYDNSFNSWNGEKDIVI